MTKNQLNYLLVLATLIVVWLYFNTFFMAMPIGRRIPSPSVRPPTPMMGQRPDFKSFMPGQYRNQGLQTMPAKMPNLPPNLQQFGDAAQTFTTVPTAPVPAAPVPTPESEKKA